MTGYRTTPIAKGLIFIYFLVFASLITAQDKKDCGVPCFKTEILSIEDQGDCYRYQLQVTYDGTCRFELSHYDFEPDCGIISDASNSMGWPMEFNHTDPTTGLGGLKVDNISGFGKDPDFTTFLVSFTVCPDEHCDENADCITPRVAYKASTCVYYEDIEVQCKENVPLEVSVQKQDLLCAGADDGNIQLTISGGQPPYSISWNNGHAGGSLENLGAGTYEYMVRDASDKELTGTVVLEEPRSLDIIGQVSHLSCGAESRLGSIDISVSGGTAPYIYLWSHGITSEDVDQLQEGQYSVMVTDVNGCTAEKSFNLLTTTDINASANIINPSCDGLIPGSIDLTISGGTEPYEIVWSGTTQQGASISGLTDNYYSATITDANGCSIKRTYRVKTVIDIEVEEVITHIKCNETTGGSIDLSISGGIGPYNVVWADGPETEDRDGLESGRYNATITDQRGCEVSWTGYVKIDQIYVYPVQKSDPTCAGASDGSIDLKVYYGEGPYEYHWSDGSTAESRDNLTAGSYYVEVVDVNGCIADRTIELTDPAAIVVSYEVIPPSCTGQFGYSVMIDASGGTGEYTYLWSNGAITADLTGIAAGTYSLTVTDGNGCSNTENIVVDGGSGNYNCLISGGGIQPECGTAGYVLDGVQEGALTYQWRVESTDGSWQIDGESNGPQVSYTAGNAGTTAVFFLDVTFESGCTASCALERVSCMAPPDGGDPGDGEDPEDPDGENPNDKGCDDCFYSDPISAIKEGEVFNYTIKVLHEDLCRHDLSHVTVAVPECAMVVDYSNNMGWKMEWVHPDPTTGLRGIKVDDIPAFGKDSGPDSFEIYISLTTTDPTCLEKLACFEPEIAYKAATCVSYQNSSGICLEMTDQMEGNAYPNPTEDYVFIDDQLLQTDGTYTLDLFNSNGLPVNTGVLNSISPTNPVIDLGSLKDGLYFIRITNSEGEQKYFKVLKK